MKKLLPLLAMVLLGAGCTPTVTPPDVLVPPSEPPASTTTHFESAELGLAFEYPTSWGMPEVAQEGGQENEVYNGCVYQRTVSFSGLGGTGLILVAASSSGTCKAPGREAYWGDNGPAIAPDRAYIALCETGEASVCDTFRTKSGELVWHHRFPTYVIPFEERVLTDVDEYSLYHEGHPLTGVMISEERFLSYGHDDKQDDLRALVESIEFVAAPDQTVVTTRKLNETVTNGPVTVKITDTDITTTVSCGDENCFEPKFTACEKAKMTVDLGFGSFSYEILGKVSGGCSVKMSYPKNPNPAWVNQPMTCVLDNALSLNAATQQQLDLVAQGKGTCTGPLADIMSAP